MSQPASSEVAHRSGNLLPPLTHPKDQVGLRDLTGTEALGDPQHLEGALVAERRADTSVETWHGLQVVGEDVGLRRDHRVDVCLATLEVAREDLDPAAGHRGPHGPDRLGPVSGSAVGKVVARYAGQHDVSQPHGRNGVGDPCRLVGLDGIGLGRHHVTETTSARAPGSQDQEGGLALLPALVDVGAHGLLAYGVELQTAHQSLQLCVVGAAAQAYFQPRGLPFAARVDAGDLAGTVRHPDDG